MGAGTISVTLKIWRQEGPNQPGRLETYPANDIPVDMSFLEMLDVVNENLERAGKEPVAFESECREGICGTCGAMVNGQPHGPLRATTICQLYMRHFRDGDVILIEPFRANAFPLIKDLVIDRGAFDRIIQAGGYISVRTGAAPEANSIPVPKDLSEQAMASAACIACGACVAACPNASASLFTAAKIRHLAKLPQGQPERMARLTAMVRRMDAEGFGACSKHYECEAACPKSIQVTNITTMNREYLRTMFLRRWESV